MTFKEVLKCTSLRWGLLFWVILCSRKSEISWLVVEEKYGNSNWNLTSNSKNLRELGIQLPLKLGVYQSALGVPRRNCSLQSEMVRTSVTRLIHMILCTLFEISLGKIYSCKQTHLKMPDTIQQALTLQQENQERSCF